MNRSDGTAAVGSLPDDDGVPPTGRGRSRAKLMALLALVFATASTVATYSGLGSLASSYYDAANGEDQSFSVPIPSADPATLAERSLFNGSVIVPNTNGDNQSLSVPVPESALSHSLPGPNNSALSPERAGKFPGEDVVPRVKEGESPREDGMHMCTCLTDDNPANNNLPDTPRRLRWLHVPKTGTSFISTLWSYAASTSERYIDLGISSHFCSPFDDTSYSMYDFALMRRYPWEMYGARNMIPTASNSSEPISKNLRLGLVGGTQHGPLMPSLKDQNFLRSKRFARIKHKLRSWGSEIFDHNMTVVTFFRQPEERLVSAYYDGRHSSGFSPETFNKLVDASWRRERTHHCELDDVDTESANTLECFARFPGIAGCASRMLTGEACADGIAQESGLENVKDAIDVVTNHLNFVGLTEDWNESICQFHRLYAGRLDRVSGKRRWDMPLQGEFANVHKATKKKQLDIQHLHGFQDVADTVVYEAAKLKFDQMVGGNRCYEYMTWDEIRAMKHNGDGAGLPFLQADDEGEVCKPMSCSELGKQCGEWNDGCGRTVICGMCGRGRTGLPSTWRVKCVEGQCVDYCPPWDDKGYWFLSNDSPPDINKVIRSLHKREQKYLSPSDAVSICEVACHTKIREHHGFSAFVEGGLCKCGEFSTSFVRNLTLQDYSSAHDLGEMCRESRARRGAVLSAKDTQPICCPYMDRDPKATGGWKRMYVMGGSNLEGEHFDHVSMGCGGFEECKAIALKGQAEMAVFDLFNSMCHLARNVVDLRDHFTVTKDNQYRYFIDLRGSPT